VLQVWDEGGGQVRTHTDERRAALCNLFPELPGDLNVFYVQPGQRTAWHRHQRQTDHFRVLSGTIRFGRFKDPSMVWYYTFDSPNSDLYVRPGWWHGYENIGETPAVLLMYLDQKYDPSDEERMSEAEVPWEPETVSLW
jgi:dTDP-4-dehydrorhamnose 3,5-epimerase-like enzyme